MATYALNTADTTTAEIPYRDYEAGTVYIPGDPSPAITSLTFYVASAPGGTYFPLYVATAQVALTVVKGRAYQLPSTLKGCKSFKMVANIAGSVEVTFQEPYLRG